MSTIENGLVVLVSFLYDTFSLLNNQDILFLTINTCCRIIAMVMATVLDDVADRYTAPTEGGD